MSRAIFSGHSVVTLEYVAHTHTHTHTHLMALCPGLPGWACTRKVKPIWILLKQETVSGSGISWAICKSASRSRQITMPAPHHSVFYRPGALPAAQPTASKHWRQKHWSTAHTSTLISLSLQSSSSLCCLSAGGCCHSYENAPSTSVLCLVIGSCQDSVKHTHTICTHTHTFYGPFSGTTQVSQYQKGKTNLDFTEARDNEWGKVGLSCLEPGVMWLARWPIPVSWLWGLNCDQWTLISTVLLITQTACLLLPFLSFLLTFAVVACCLVCAVQYTTAAVACYLL